jgi:hypothetical protein
LITKNHYIHGSCQLCPSRIRIGRRGEHHCVKKNLRPFGNGNFTRYENLIMAQQRWLDISRKPQSKPNVRKIQGRIPSCP